MELLTSDIEIKEGQILPIKLTNFEDLKANHREDDRV